MTIKACLGAAPIGIGRDIFRINAHRFVKVQNRFLVPTQPDLCATSIVVGVGINRIDLYCRIILFNGTFEFLNRAIHYSTLKVGPSSFAFICCQFDLLSPVRDSTVNIKGLTGCVGDSKARKIGKQHLFVNAIHGLQFC